MNLKKNKLKFEEYSSDEAKINYNNPTPPVISNLRAGSIPNNPYNFEKAGENIAVYKQGVSVHKGCSQEYIQSL